MTSKVDCRTCLHFRSSPFEAKFEGCYLAKNMEAKQKQAFLDEQQQPGKHGKINFHGDCPDHAARKKPLGWWQRLWSIGA
jgi:hypothetical protein